MSERDVDRRYKGYKNSREDEHPQDNYSVDVEHREGGVTRANLKSNGLLNPSFAKRDDGDAAPSFGFQRPLTKEELAEIYEANRCTPSERRELAESRYLVVADGIREVTKSGQVSEEEVNQAVRKILQRKEKAADAIRKLV